MIRRGISRARARLKQDTTPFELDGFRRSFRYYDGQPMWTPVGGGDKVATHPRGWQCEWNEAGGRYLWRKAGGQSAWDTNV